MPSPPEVTAFFDEATFTVTYVAADSESGHAVIIDSVLDFDAASGRTAVKSADKVLTFVQERALTVDRILETHAHADHLTAAPYLKSKLGCPICIGAHITDVQKAFKGVFNLDGSFAPNGSDFDLTLDHGDTFKIGGLDVQVMHTPGHTPACSTYVIGDAAFVGDTLFMPDYGSARCDFPGGDAATLYRSVRAILNLPPETRIFTCHDYGPNGRPFAWESTVAEQRARNIHLHDGVTEAEFVRMRTERDETLTMPALIIPSIQVNIRAGELPSPEENGTAYLKLPLNAM